MRPVPSCRAAAVFAATGFACTGLAGCVTHAPMSETLLFHSPNTSPRLTNEAAAGLAFTYSVNPNYGNLCIPTDEVSCAGLGQPDNARSQSAGAYVGTYTKDGGVAMSVTAGAGVLGADMAVRLTRRNYVVAGVSYPGSVQAWAMHRTLNERGLAAGVGVGVWHSKYSWGLGRSTETRRAVAVRAYAMPRLDGVTVVPRLSVTLGYAPDDRAATALVTLSLGGQ